MAASLLHSAFGDGGSSAVSSVVVTISSTTTGSTIIVTVFADRSGISSITDNQSQSYTLGPVQTNTSHGLISNAYFANSVSGVTSVTVNLFGIYGVLVEEWSGLTSTPADTNSTGTDNFGHGGDTFSTGTSGTTAQANELVLAMFQEGTATNPQTNAFSTPSGFTLDQTGTWGGTTGAEYLQAYQIVSVTGTQTASSVCTTANPAGGGVQIQGFISTWKIASTGDVITIQNQWQVVVQ